MQNRTKKQQQPGILVWLFRVLLSACVLAAAVWSIDVCRRIQALAQEDQAQPSDAIAVFGAAEYSGRPSPVLHARLDHAVELYRKHIAPVVITLGGGTEAIAGRSEGEVGRDYLLAKSIPFDKIVAETESNDTEQQVISLAAIAKRHNFRSLVVVSDGTHMYRIQQLCRAAGLDVYTSPRRPLGNLDRWDLMQRYVHEVAGYTFFRFRVWSQVREP